MACRIAVVLQTPPDEHSAVHLSYTILGDEVRRMGGALRIVTPRDVLPAAATGRFTPLVYPSAVRRWVTQHVPDCDLLVFHSYAGWRAGPVCSAAGVPFVVAFHGLEPLYHQSLVALAGKAALSRRYRLLQEQLMPAFLRRACRGAALVTCLNSMEAAALERRGWAPRDRIRVTRHGLIDEFFAAPRVRQSVRQLLFVGQWLPMKGVATLARAATRLLAAYPDLELTCAGTLAPVETVLAGFAPAVRGRVRVFPRCARAALIELYRGADAFVFPSLYEGFGRALLEAMASGLPIVTTAVGIAADALTDGRSCLRIPVRDEDALVRSVERLRNDPALATAVASGARAAAEAYRASVVVRELAVLLTSVARRPETALS